MSKHNENILELVSKTIYETTILCKVNEGDYIRHMDRIKKMVRMYAEEYADSILEETIENTTSTEDTNNNPIEDEDTEETK